MNKTDGITNNGLPNSSFRVMQDMASKTKKICLSGWSLITAINHRIKNRMIRVIIR